MKIDRLIAILTTLLQKDKVTAAYLAEKFEVSERTILRDIDTLNRAGIPIITTQGSGGGIAVSDNYKIDKTLLSSEDLQSILSGLRGLDSISDTNKYKLLIDKLSADTSDTLNIDSHIIIDLSMWDKSAFADKIHLIKNAIENRMKISFRYFSPNGESERVIEPYHIVFQWSSWYVWGYCINRGDYRMFKLSRMTELECTNEHCENRTVPEYTCDKLRHTKGEIKSIVKFDDSVKWRIIDEFGADFLKYNENGEIEITFTWSDVPSFYRYILTFGDMAEIISPPEYRREFLELLKKIQKNYKI